MDESIPQACLDSCAVFPVPATVLFPGTVIPLQITEPRYHTMLDELLASDPYLTVVATKRKQDAAKIDAELCAVGCAGRIIHHQNSEQGRCNILVHGLVRVRLLQEHNNHGAYRRFQIEPFVAPGKKAIDEARLEMAQLQSCVLNLRSTVASTDKQLAEVLSVTSDPLELADILCAVLVNDAQRRQQLLAEASLKLRLRGLIDTIIETMAQVESRAQRSKMN